MLNSNKPFKQTCHANQQTTNHKPIMKKSTIQNNDPILLKGFIKLVSVFIKAFLK